MMLLLITILLRAWSIQAEYKEHYYNETYMTIYTYGCGVAVNSYDEAQELCAEKGGRIVEMKNEHQQRMVDHFVNTTDLILNQKYYYVKSESFKHQYFIGMKREDLKPGVPVSVLRQPGLWQPEISYINDNGSFLFLNGVNFGRSGLQKSISFYCVNSYSCRDNSALPSSTRCYRKHTTPATWYTARNYCIKSGGDLADFDVDPTLYKDMDPKEYWVGYSDIRWYWESEPGYFANYTNWRSGHGSATNGDDKKCVVMVIGEGWKELPCNLTNDSRTFVICTKEENSKRVPKLTTNSSQDSKMKPRMDTLILNWSPKKSISLAIAAIVFSTLLIGIIFLMKDICTRNKTSSPDVNKNVICDTSYLNDIHDKITDKKISDSYDYPVVENAASNDASNRQTSSSIKKYDQLTRERGNKNDYLKCDNVEKTYFNDSEKTIDVYDEIKEIAYD